MKTAIVIAALLLGGCAAVPTLQHCQHVEYVRDGSRIKLTAECVAPIGGVVSLTGV